MFRSTRILIYVLLVVALAACAPKNALIVTVPPEEPPAAMQASPTAPGEIPGEPASQPTSDEALLQPQGIVPEETPLPPLELAPPEVNLPPVEIWDGLPTYLAESAPDTYFRLNYNPYLWSQTEDLFGQTVLAHREIPYCVITPATGRGLPMSFNTGRETRLVGPIEYEINLTYKDDILQFVSYYGGTPGELYTGFQVSVPEEQSETCLQEAETVLATLRAVPLDQATPVR
jgi:hypothetical protein